MSALAKAFAASHDGHFRALKLKLRGVEDAVAEVELGKRQELSEAERESGAVTTLLWARYEAAAKRGEFEMIKPVACAGWLEMGRVYRYMADVRRCMGVRERGAGRGPDPCGAASTLFLLGTPPPPPAQLSPAPLPLLAAAAPTPFSIFLSSPRSARTRESRLQALPHRRGGASGLTQHTARPGFRVWPKQRSGRNSCR